MKRSAERVAEDLIIQRANNIQAGFNVMAGAIVTSIVNLGGVGAAAAYKKSYICFLAFGIDYIFATAKEKMFGSCDVASGAGMAMAGGGHLKDCECCA